MSIFFRRKGVILLAFFFATIIIGGFLDIFGPVRSSVSSIFIAPVYSMQETKNSLRNFLFFGGRAAGELERLKSENAQLTQDLLRAQVLSQEYDDLRAELSKMPENEFVLGHVLTRRLDGFSNAILIDGGINQGIKEGMAVVGTGALVGYIKETSKNTSIVELTFSPFVEISGILSTSGIPVILEGEGSGFLHARLPKDIDIQIGEIIVKDASEFFIIGEVVDVDISSASPLKEIIVRSPIEILTLKRVFIEL
ncbi:rod shape-determining protein MreC [Patescibacteria group bacterium]